MERSRQGPEAGDFHPLPGLPPPPRSLVREARRPDCRRLRIESDRSDPGLHPRAGILGRPDSDPARAHARDPSHPCGCPRGMPSEIGGNRRKSDPCGEDRGRRDRCDLAPHRGTRRLADPPCGGWMRLVTSTKHSVFTLSPKGRASKGSFLFDQIVQQTVHGVDEALEMSSVTHRR